MHELSIESQFTQYPTAAISDALDELDIYGVVQGVAPQRYDQGRVAGRALPVKLKPKAADPEAWRFGGGVGKPLEQVLKTMRAGQMVVMDLGGTREASAWGGLASRLAQLRGVKGTVMWGTCRDVEEIRQIGYPVWAVGTSPRRSRNEYTFGSIGEPIEIGRVTIAPNDVVVADASGVVCVPQARISDVLELLGKITRQEALLEDQVLRNDVRSWDEL